MKLQDLSVCCYRTLDNLKLHFHSNYCTLSGKNNSGKSAVLSLITKLMRAPETAPWEDESSKFSYLEDKTQWIKDEKPITVQYDLLLTRTDDPALLGFLERQTKAPIPTDSVVLQVGFTVAKSDAITVSAAINGKAVEEQIARDIAGKLHTSNLLFLHNSTYTTDDFYFQRGRMRSFSHVLLSDEEHKELARARKFVSQKMKSFARRHRSALTELLGRMSDKFEVEFSSMESHSRMVPFIVNLKDKKVQGPLTDWGSGTQNRTHILMSLLQANRIKTQADVKDRITPIVVIEEPESFLHPSAQAEFGRLLRTFSDELGIQLIVTTHNPYMLNQESPQSNILLDRRSFRGKLAETYKVEVSGDQWMAPFAEHIGLVPDEFDSWLPVFTARKSRVLLVEGDLDKEYFTFIRDNGLTTDPLDKDVEIVPYGGRGALANGMLLKFVLSKFQSVFITFDLDAKKEVTKVLQQLGLRENQDYAAVGCSTDGKDCIEGLIPTRIFNSVMALDGDLALRLGSGNKDVREKARSEFKHKVLDAFKRETGYTKPEMAEFSNLVSMINKKMKANKSLHPTPHKVH